jgi:DMSO/TMAO reductase YedYZ heme-binding membrane subunit
MVTERTLRLAFLSLALVHFALGVWMFFFPRSFYATIGAFDAYNRHYERDTATFYFGFALGSWFAATRPAWRVPVLAMTTAQYAIHTINHGIDVDNANNSWAGPFDLISLALATVQFAGLLLLLLRPRAERTRA